MLKKSLGFTAYRDVADKNFKIDPNVRLFLDSVVNPKMALKSGNNPKGNLSSALKQASSRVETTRVNALKAAGLLKKRSRN